MTEFYCSVCFKSCDDLYDWNLHIETESHEINLTNSGLECNYYCENCNTTCIHLHNWKGHTHGKKHRSTSHSIHIKPESHELNLINSGLECNYYCKICEKSCTNLHNWKAHINSKKHRSKSSKQYYYRCEQCKDKFGTKDALLEHQKVKGHEVTVAQVNAYFLGKSKMEIIIEMCQNLHKITPSSIKEGLAILSLTYINIYDYVAGKFDKILKTFNQLRISVRERTFPLKKAKNENLKYLLKTVF